MLVFDCAGWDLVVSILDYQLVYPIEVCEQCYTGLSVDFEPNGLD